MKITRVETILLEYELPSGEPWGWNGGSISGWTAAFVRVHSDTGIDGLGECCFGNFVPEMGEGISSLADAVHLLHDRPVDYIQPDATIAGGITACRRIGALAEARHVQLDGHSWGFR